jgi:hypothetical protein
MLNRIPISMNADGKIPLDLSLTLLVEQDPELRASRRIGHGD